MSRALKSSMYNEYQEYEDCEETMEQYASQEFPSQNALRTNHETLKVESKWCLPAVNDIVDDSTITSTNNNTTSSSNDNNNAANQHLVDDYCWGGETFSDKHVARNRFYKSEKNNLTLSPTKRTKVLSKKVAPAFNVALCDLEHEKMNDNANVNTSADISYNKCRWDETKCDELSGSDDDDDDDDDENYYIVNEKPLPTVEERLEKIKEKLNTQYDRKYDEWRLRNRIPCKPRTLIKTKSGVVNVLQCATEDMQQLQIDNVAYNQAQNDSNYTNYM